jgi:hypothetical protein
LPGHRCLRPRRGSFVNAQAEGKPGSFKMSLFLSSNHAFIRRRWNWAGLIVSAVLAVWTRDKKEGPPCAVRPWSRGLPCHLPPRLCPGDALLVPQPVEPPRPGCRRADSRWPSAPLQPRSPLGGRDPLLPSIALGSRPVELRTVGNLDCEGLEYLQCGSGWLLIRSNGLMLRSSFRAIRAALAGSSPPR